MVVAYEGNYWFYVDEGVNEKDFVRVRIVNHASDPNKLKGNFCKTAETGKTTRLEGAYFDGSRSNLDYAFKKPWIPIRNFMKSREWAFLHKAREFSDLNFIELSFINWISKKFFTNLSILLICDIIRKLIE